MALPVDQLFRALTPAEVKASIYRLLSATGLPVTSWQEGAVVRTIIAVIATVFAGFTSAISEFVKSGFLDTATGGWLTLLAFFVYNVTRIEATFATGKVRLTNAGGGIYALDPGDLVVRNPATNTTFVNTEAVTLQAVGDPGAVRDVAIRAFEVGAASTSAPGQITELVTTLLGVTVTNLSPVIGQDAEGDPAVRQRCRDALGMLSPNGPRTAYEFLAKSAKRADGTSVGITRVKVPLPPGDGTLQVIVATASGGVSGAAGDLNTDLGVVDSQIQRWATPIGATPTVSSGVGKNVSAVMDVWVDAAANLEAADVRALIAPKLSAYFPTIPIGGFVLPPAVSGKVSFRALEGQAEAAHPAIIEAKLASEADTDLLANEVALLILDPTTDIVVHQVQL
jgi:hypothetical protein